MQGAECSAGQVGGAYSIRPQEAIECCEGVKGGERGGEECEVREGDGYTLPPSLQQQLLQSLYYIR